MILFLPMHHHEGHGHPFAFLGSREALFEEYLVTKAPFQLPVGAKEFLVNVAPYLTILFLVLALPMVLALFGLGAFWSSAWMMSPYMAGNQVMYYVIGILTLIMFILEIMAVPGLFARTRKAWHLLYYVQLISLLVGVISGGII